MISLDIPALQMKRVQSFKKLKTSQLWGDESPTARNGTSKHSRPRSVSAVSTSSFFTAIALHDGLGRLGKFAEQHRGASSTTLEADEGTDGMDVGQSSLNLTPVDGSGGEAPIVASSASTLSGAAGMCSPANGMSEDVSDGAPMLIDTQRENLKRKIAKISEEIRIAQACMNENVEEYLKLANNADKQQAGRIKTVFEKKNQKLKATVAQYQKKLISYHRRYKELESSGTKAQGGGKYGLKEVGAKLTDFSGGVVGTVKQGILNSSKLMNKRFGSVDNIISSQEDCAETFGLDRSNSAESVSAATSDSGEMLFVQTPSSQHSHARSPPLLRSEVKEQIASLEKKMDLLSSLATQQELLKSEVDQISMQIKRDIGILTTTVEDSSYRCAGIESQLHDLSEMHHREMGDVKQDLASLEEKLIYHDQERARDIQEALEGCQTRISKMEVQQLHTRQELVTMEGVENATARALIGKLMNVLLSLVAVVLVFASILSKFATPFMKNQTRAAVTCVCVIAFALLYKNWELWSEYIFSSGVESGAPHEHAEGLPDPFPTEKG